MPFCRGCGAEFAPGASFCKRCGQAAPQTITPAVVASTTQNTEPPVSVQQMAPLALNQMAAGPLLLSKQIPEKEYDVTGWCFQVFTCGGSQKLKFHAKEIEMEEHVVFPWCPCSLVSLLTGACYNVAPAAASFAVLGPITALFCINCRTHQRVPYTKITSIEYDKTCDKTGCGLHGFWMFHIFDGRDSWRKLTQSRWICDCCGIVPKDQGNAEAMITDIVETINNKKREHAN